jgi:hypothetical protein
LLATATIAVQAVYLISRQRAAVIVCAGFVAYLLLGVGTAYLTG